MNQRIQCPECKSLISVDEALSRQVETKLKLEFDRKQSEKEADFNKRVDSINKLELELSKRKHEIETVVTERISKQLSLERSKIYEEAKYKIEKDQNERMALLRAELQNTAEKLKKASQSEIEFLKKSIALKAEKESFELEKMRQVEELRLSITSEARQKALEESKHKMNILQSELENAEAKIKQARQVEIEYLNKSIALKNEKETFELEKIRQLEEAKAIIMAESRQKAEEDSQYKIAQLQKQLQDSIKAKDELARKLEQGSQKSQGQVFEYALEDLLKTEFHYDEISPVPIGVSGADIVHRVRDNAGRDCGQMIWESKNTKTWNEGWIQKLKDDQRNIKADVAILVSSVLPNDIKNFGLRDGIWVCDFNSIVGLATALRINLESIHREKRMSIGKNEKMEAIYAYLTGSEFKQRVEAIAESFFNMSTIIQKERAFHEKNWAEREKNLKKLLTNTSGMYGDFCGLAVLPEIKMLEIGN